MGPAIGVVMKIVAVGARPPRTRAVRHDRMALQSSILTVVSMLPMGPLAHPVR
jgi:hypothetical protein